MEICTLKKTPDGGYDKASIKELNADIAAAFTKALENIKVNGVEHYGRLPVEIKKALYTIGDKWNNSQLTEIVKRVLKYLDTVMMHKLDAYLPAQGIRNTLSKSAREAFGSVHSAEEYFEQEDIEEVDRMPSLFLDEAFGNQAKIKNELKQKVTHSLLSAFIIDRNGGRIITDATEANISAKKHKLQLFESAIRKWADAQGRRVTQKDLKLFNDDGTYAGGLENPVVKDIILTSGYYRIVQNAADILKLHDALASGKTKEYDAFCDWFTLMNYDNFIKLLIGDSIEIDPKHRGKFLDGEAYSYASKHGNLITSYRTNDNIDLTVEINKLAQSLINSTPFYKAGSNTPTDKFIKFEDFFRLVTKIKDLVLNPKVSQDYIYTRQNEDFKKLDPEDKPYVEGKTLREIINSVRSNPQIYGKLVFKLLTPKVLTELGFNEEERDKVWSIYKGIFETGPRAKSINSIQSNYDHRALNYYNMLTLLTDSIFSVDFLQYYENEGVILVHPLRDQSANNVQRNIEATIGAQNSRRILSENYEQNYMKPWLAKIIKVDLQPPTGIMYAVGNLLVILDNARENSIIYMKDGKQLINPSQKDFEGINDLYKFIDEQLHLDLEGDRELTQAMNIIFNGQYIKPLLDLATSVFFNKYLSNVEFKDVKGYLNLVAGLTRVYAESDYKPGYNSQLNEISLIPNVLTPILEKIANSKIITTGEAQSTQVRDAENNMLSTLTTSRLLGGLSGQHEIIRKGLFDSQGNFVARGAAAHFSYLNPGTYKGHYASKEYKAVMNSKQETGFTVSEFMHGAFVYDFVGGFTSNNNAGKKVFSNGTVSFYPSVNSDKGTIGRIVIDLTKTISQGPHAGKTFQNLSSEEVDEQTAFELGLYYETMHTKVLSDFDRLRLFVRETENLDIEINPDDDFGALNDFCLSNNTTADKWLYAKTLKYNTLHPQDPIQLIDQTHFIKDKVNKGRIMYNPTVQILRRRFKNPARMRRFMDLKRAELFTGLLKENFTVDLYNEPANAGSKKNLTPKQWLQLNYPDWVHSYRSKNGKMAIARLTVGGKQYNITTKAELLLLLPNHPDILDNPHELVNPKYGIKLELHPMLARYNSLDYLFTQEHMISGVGTHSNHPSKAKTKTPIVWAHPAIGKTFSIKNGKYADRIIDWDVEFNRRRDAWIANKYGVEIGTPEFKDARNRVLVGYSASHPETIGFKSPDFWQNNKEFRDFVTSEWTRVKAKANHQHKMLVASPSMLLDMFGGDFTKVLNMDTDDFIQRGKARGDSDPADWKKGIEEAIGRYRGRFGGKKVSPIARGKYLEQMLDDGDLYDEMKTIDDNEMAEESSRFLAQHKRNVSYTAAMHEFLLNQVDGIPTHYNMAMIKGVPAWVYTISGDVKNDQDAFDGATFVNPLVVIWENNSLKGNKAGIDKKLFVHFYDEATGTGGIIKTAGFGCTNDRARRYRFYRTMMWNMMKRDWLGQDGKPLVVKPNGILEDFNGNKVDYGTFFFKKGAKYYQRRILSYNNNNTYLVEDVEVDKDGNVIGDSNVHATGPITSNYDLWEMFGGAHSMEMNHNGSLQYSEKSIDLTARAANNYGIKKAGVTTVRSSEDVYQPMKHSDIHYMPTDGAVKQGAANINSEDKFFRRMTPTGLARTNILNNLPYDALNIQRVRMTLAGIQLDKEHHADKAVLSLMTQVISAASAKSFMPGELNGLKTALNELTKIGTRNFRDELGKLHLQINGDLAKFDAAVTDIIMDTVLNSTSSDGSLMLAIANRIRTKLGKNFTITEANAKSLDLELPYSSPEIFHKIVSSLTVALTKKGIKTKMPGVLSVLCPTHEIIKFYKIPIDPKNPNSGFKRVTFEEAEDYFYNHGTSIPGIEEGTDEWFDKQLDYLQSQEQPLTKNQKGLITPDPSLTQIGYKYIITNPDGTHSIFRIVKPNSISKKAPKTVAELKAKGETKYHNFSTNLDEPIKIYDVGYQDLVNLTNNNQVFEIKEWNRDGLDLNAYGVRFKDSEGNSYQLGDLDIVLDYFGFKELESDNEKLAELRRLLTKYGAGYEFSQRVKTILSNAWKDNLTDPRKILIDTIQVDRILSENKAEDIKKVLDGGDLTSMDLNFVATVLGDPNIQTLRALFANFSPQDIEQTKSQYREFILKMGTGFLNRTMLLLLNAISPSNQRTINARVQGKQVSVDKSSIAVQSYGIIMPKVFASNLGLDPFDNIEEIKNDPLFFTKKLVKRFGTKVETGYPVQKFDEKGEVIMKNGAPDVFSANNFDVEFKRMDGKHIYLKVGSRKLNADGTVSISPKNTDYVTEIQYSHKVNDKGLVYRTDDRGNFLHLLHSLNDRIFLDREGNEIIVTDEDTVEYHDKEGNVVPEENVLQAGDVYVNVKTGEEVTKHGDSGLKFYMDSLSYNTLNINTQNKKIFARCLGIAEASNNKKANIYASILGRLPDEKAKMSLAKKMNDYSSVLNEKGEIKGNIGKILSQQGREMHTSFMRSLNIIAARIPAQNQQSFMPMECQAFDNPDINTAYVSIFQFFLQGSDLDIDAVSLLTFDIDANGLYQGHSPYYSLENSEMRKLSENLPFPTGFQAELYLDNDEADNFLETHSDLIGPEGSDALFILSKNSNGLVRANLNVDGSSVDTNIEDDFERGKAEIRAREVAKINLQKMADLIADVNENGIVVSEDPAVVKEIAEKINTRIMGAKNGEQIITERDIPFIIHQIKKAIDKHNLYLKNANPKLLESIVKNYAITQLFNIIEDPINLLEAQSSVDTVTGPVKDLSKSSPKATVQSVFTPGCVLNKFLSVNENMVGKDGISICATGLKSFFGITDLYQNVLNGDDAEEKDKLLFNVKIGGRTYHGLANGFSTKFRSVFEEDDSDMSDEEFTRRTQEYLMEQLWEDDAANGMSAFLGLSTDNAKELVLAKINAGTSTMGMYLYGLSIGIPTSTLYQIMTTPLAFRLAELTKGDIFNGDSGLFSILNAIKYLYSEPNLGLFEQGEWERGQLSPRDYVISELVKKFNIKGDNPITTLNKYITPENIVQKTAEIKLFLESLRGRATGLLLDTKDSTRTLQYETSVNKIIDFLELYIDDVNLTKQNTKYNTIYGESDLFMDLEKLAMGAEEMKAVGRILSLNQGIKTNPSDLIKQIKNIEQLAIKRLNVIKSFAERHPTEKWAQKFKNEKAENYRIDLLKFMTDPEAQQRYIDLYDVVRVSYNPLRVIKEVKHYNGYVESLLSAYKGIEHKSLKWKALTKIADKFIAEAKVTNKSLQDLVYKNVERGVDMFLRDEWLKTSVPGITIPASTPEKPTKVFVDDHRAVANRHKREIMLGTPIGNANFKLYMDSVIIPELKRDKRYKDNKFIRSLSLVLNTSTNLGTISVAFGLPINMMPKSEYERDLFNEMKDGFSELSSVLYDGKPLLDLFYLYSMISFNGRVGPRSLHGIFEDYNGAPILSYHRFVSEADSNLDGPIWSDLSAFVSQVKVIAPFSSVSKGGSDVFKVKNKNTDTIELWSKFKPSREEREMYDNNPELEPYTRNGYRSNGAINPFANYTFFSDPIPADSKKMTASFSGKSIQFSFSPIFRDGKLRGISVDLMEAADDVKKDPEIIKRLRDIIGENGVEDSFLQFTPDGISVDMKAIEDHLENNCLTTGGEAPF